MKARNLIPAVLLLASVATLGQSIDSAVYVKNFPGVTVGAKVTNAMATCGTNAAVPCVLVIDPSLAAAAPGTLPSLCGHCYLMDFRSGPPSGGGGSGTNLANIAALRAYAGTASQVNVVGYYSATDGGGGVFVDQGAGSSADDGGVTIFDSVTGHNWKRQITGTEIYGAWWGPKGDNSTDNSTQIQAAISYMHGIHGGTLHWPGGIFRHSTAITVTSAFAFEGAGKQFAGFFQNLGTTFYYTGSPVDQLKFNPDVVGEGEYAWQNMLIRHIEFYCGSCSGGTPKYALGIYGGSQFTGGGLEDVTFTNWSGGDYYFHIGLPTTTSPVTGYISDGTGLNPGKILCITAGGAPVGPYMVGAGIPDYTFEREALSAPVALFPAICTGPGGGTPYLITQSLNISSETIQMGYGSTGAYYQSVKFSDISTSGDAQFIGTDPQPGYSMREFSIDGLNHENGQNFAAGIPSAYINLQGMGCYNLGVAKRLVFEGSADSNPNFVSASGGGAACTNNIGYLYTETGTMTHPLNHVLDVINDGYVGPTFELTDLGSGPAQSAIYFEPYVIGSHIEVNSPTGNVIPSFTSGANTAYNFVTQKNGSLNTWSTDYISRSRAVDMPLSGPSNPWNGLARSLQVNSATAQPLADLHGQWLDGYANSMVSIGMTSAIANEGIVTDSTEGRVFEVQSANNAYVPLQILISNIPADLIGSQMTVSMRWKLRTSQSSYGFTPLQMNSSLGNYPQNIKSDATLSGATGGCTHFSNNAWHSSFITFEATNAAQFGVVTANGPGCPAATGTQYLDIAAITVSIGGQVVYSLGGGTSTAAASWNGIAPPTYGTYVAGDTVRNSAFAGNGIKEWIFSALGGWTAIYNPIVPVSDLASLSSGTVTVPAVASCLPTGLCGYSFTNCGKGSSTAVGTLELGTVTPGTSFVINSLDSSGAVATADNSTVCWSLSQKSVFPVGQWLLNEGGAAIVALDSSGRGNNATWVGTQSCSGSYYTSSALAPLTEAGCLDGSTNYLTLPNAPVLSVSGTVTVSAWINGNTSSSGMVVSNHDTATTKGYALNVAGGFAGFNTYGNGSSGSAYGAVGTGWHHICGTYNGATGSIYVDGALASGGSPTFTGALLLDASPQPVLLGTSNQSLAGDAYLGSVEDVRIYNLAPTGLCPAIYAAGPGI